MCVEIESEIKTIDNIKGRQCTKTLKCINNTEAAAAETVAAASKHHVGLRIKTNIYTYICTHTYTHTLLQNRLQKKVSFNVNNRVLQGNSVAVKEFNNICLINKVYRPDYREVHRPDYSLVYIGQIIV